MDVILPIQTVNIGFRMQKVALILS